MSPVLLPFDIIALIIDTVGENKDTNLLKELSLVSQSFLQICSKHLFATVILHDANPNYHLASTKKGFAKLLKTRLDVVKYIRKFTYYVAYNTIEDHQLSSILLNIFPIFSCLTHLAIIDSYQDWNTLNSPLTSAFLHLMHLPTINRIEISNIQNFPLSSLTLSINLHRLDIAHLGYVNPLEEESSPETILEMMPKIRELHTSNSSLPTTKLLQAKTQDGQSAFDIMELRRLSMSFVRFEDERNIRYLLQNAKLLEKFDLSVFCARSLVGILSLCPSTLKDLKVALHNSGSALIGGLCEELEALAGHNKLEALSFALQVDGNATEDSLGSIMQEVEKVLVKPGWSTLRQVSLKISIAPWGNSDKLCEALQSLPQKYLSHLSKLKSISFNYSAYLLTLVSTPAT